MLERFRRIKREFGTWTFVRVVLLLIGLIVMPVIGFAALGSPWAMVISVGGLLIGWAMREVIVEQVEKLAWVTRGTLLALGVISIFGERILGYGRKGQLLMLTATFVFAFSTEFWARSDPRIVKLDD